ncbi:hypothetical protein [Halanaerobacter jeridensis]|uniref:Uncharacterized protein n=1 Tax=Halanaerobacter jeridensis TaxID=706427 RepID=A0A938XQN6_9FIRM|nr:hypothetical protein [Halanaerobacter jeridensis]MBM7558133.1 hypothetical protein [Halanaerobacter jeridensis]
MVGDGEIQLVDIFLEELNLDKFEATGSKKKFLKNNKKSMEEENQVIELSGQIMYSPEDEEAFKYIFGMEFKMEGEFKISLVYETYFILKNNNSLEINDNMLAERFNYHIWPYVTEQINNITSKMDLDGGIIIPSYGMISNES